MGVLIGAGRIAIGRRGASKEQFFVVFAIVDEIGNL